MRKGWCLAEILLFLFCVPIKVKAEETVSSEKKKELQSETAMQNETEQSQTEQSQTEQEIKEELLSEIDLNEIEDSLAKLYPERQISFSELVDQMTEGDLEGAMKLLGGFLKQQLGGELFGNRRALVMILVLTVFAALFTNFSEAFQNRQISETGFYAVYLLLITVGLKTLQVVIDGTQARIGMLLEFMKVLSPAYFLAVALSSGGTTSLAFYNIVLFLIYLTELVIQNVLLPLIHVFLMIRVLNSLSREDHLSQFAGLLQRLIAWGLKLLLGCVVGLNVVQGILSPALDTLQRNLLTKGAEALPGVGNAFGSVMELTLSTASVIKNGIGLAGALICVVICAVPVLQAAVAVLLYKCLAAFTQPVSDYRITECISGFGDGMELLLKVMVTTGLLFLITIAVVAFSASA